MSAPVAPLHQQLLETTLREMFPDLTPALLGQLLPLLRPLELPGGSILMQQGDPSDAIYFVLSGRLRASVRDANGAAILLNEFGRGEPIGEIGVISEAPRTATITALRDCVLFKLTANDCLDVLSKSPSTLLQLARKTIARLTHDQQRGGTRKRVVNVCLVPLSPSLDTAKLAQRLCLALTEQLDRSMPVATAKSHRVAVVERAALSENILENTQAQRRMAAWMEEQESGHDMQVFVTDAHDSAWSRLCLRHADHILLMADANDSSAPRAIETALLSDANADVAVTQSLWLLHPDDRRIPTHTARWLQARPHIRMNGLSHFHTRREHASDWARLARILSGQALGLVLAGGGARGFSQLGIMQAMEEAGVEWDMVGGTSIGSVMGAYAAMDLPIKQVISLAGQAFARNPTSDVSWLPLVSIVKGQRLRQVVSQGLLDALGSHVNIEDLWKPFFCVASNYSRQEIEVMRLGTLGEALMASAAIPAALPPVLRDNGDLLIDGCTFNNFPVDIMQTSGATRLVGVDHSRGNYRPMTFKTMPTTWQLLVDKLFRSSKKRLYKGLPSLAAMVVNVSTISSTAHEKRMRGALDLAFTPDVSRYGMLDWSAFSRIVQVGLQHGRERLTDSQPLLTARWISSKPNSD